MNVLYLSYDGITDPLGQSQILPYLKGLCQEGYQFTLVGFEKRSNYSSQKEIIEKEIQDYPIDWIASGYHKNPAILSTLYDLWNMKQVSKKVVKDKNVRLVHCRSYLTMLIGLYLKKRFGIKLIFDMRGFWADERVDGEIWNIKNALYNRIYKYFKRKEIEFAMEADHIVSLTEAGKSEMVSGRLFNKKIKIASDKISVIPCSVDVDLFNPASVSGEQVSSLREKLKLPSDKKVMIYLGSLGTWYLINEMLQFYRVWKNEHGNYIFLWVTKDDKHIVLDHANREGIDPGDLYFASATRKEVPIFLKLADIGISFIKPAYSKKASSAVKMGEMMSMGLDLIFNTGIGDQDRLETYQTDILQNFESQSSLPLKMHASPRTDLSQFKLKNGIESYKHIYAKFMR